MYEGVIVCMCNLYNKSQLDCQQNGPKILPTFTEKGASKCELTHCTVVCETHYSVV